MYPEIVPLPTIVGSNLCDMTDDVEMNPDTGQTGENLGPGQVDVLGQRVICDGLLCSILHAILTLRAKKSSSL